MIALPGGYLGPAQHCRTLKSPTLLAWHIRPSPKAPLPLPLPHHLSYLTPPKQAMHGHTSMPMPTLYPFWSHALPSLSLPPKRAKFCSLFRAQLKCHVLWESFPCPSSKENNHPSCWRPQPRTHCQESCRAESVISPLSLSAVIYKMEANHFNLRERVLEEFSKRGHIKPLTQCGHTVHAQQSLVENSILASQSCPEQEGCIRHAFHPSIPALFRGSSGSLFSGTLPAHSSLEDQQ